MIVVVAFVGVVGIILVKPTSCERCPNVPPTKANVCQLFHTIGTLKRFIDSCNNVILHHLDIIGVGFIDCCNGDPIGQTPCI